MNDYRREGPHGTVRDRTPDHRKAHDGNGDDRSVGQLFSQLTGDMGRLVRDEVELAKTEIKDDARQLGRSGGMLGGAGFAGYMAAVMASFAGAWGLSEVMAPGWAFLVMTGIWGAVAGVLFVLGRERMRRMSLKPEETIETIKEDVTWARDLTS